MQTPACPLCKSQDNEERFLERGYTVFVCHVCGLFFINPYPEIGEVQHRVSEYEYDEIEILDVTKHYLAEVQFYQRYFPLISQECTEAKSILDVGCGTGHLLERLSIYPGLYRVGIELNAARAERARKVATCEIFQVPIEEFSSERKYDVITMINVLSHIPSFDRLFNSIHSLLQEGGKLILKTGEMRRDVRRSDVFDWGIPGHMHFLGLTTIDFICSKYGFRVCRHLRVPYSDELFLPSRWKTPGRSRVRDMVKQIVVHIPFALPILARLYSMTHGNRLFSSFIVLASLQTSSVDTYGRVSGVAAQGNHSVMGERIS